MKTFGTAKAPAAAGVQLLDARALEARGILYSRNHLRELWKAGKFPAPVHLSSRKIVWVAAEVDQWISDKQKAR